MLLLNHVKRVSKRALILALMSVPFGAEVLASTEVLPSSRPIHLGEMAQKDFTTGRGLQCSERRKNLASEDSSRNSNFARSGNAVSAI